MFSEAPRNIIHPKEILTRSEESESSSLHKSDCTEESTKNSDDLLVDGSGSDCSTSVCGGRCDRSARGCCDACWNAAGWLDGERAVAGDSGISHGGGVVSDRVRSGA